MKRQPMDLERIFAKHISDKGLISKINKYIRDIQLNSKQQIIQFKNGAKELK